MNLTIILCILTLATLTLAGVPSKGPNYSRGCLYIMGKCVTECEEGTHSYTVDCDYKIPEPTCIQPVPVAEDSIICDFSACYCDPPTVRDTVSGKCVHYEECTKAA